MFSDLVFVCEKDIKNAKILSTLNFGFKNFSFLVIKIVRSKTTIINF